MDPHSGGPVARRNLFHPPERSLSPENTPLVKKLSFPPQYSPPSVLQTNSLSSLSKPNFPSSPNGIIITRPPTSPVNGGITSRATSRVAGCITRQATSTVAGGITSQATSTVAGGITRQATSPVVGGITSQATSPVAGGINPPSPCTPLGQQTAPLDVSSPKYVQSLYKVYYSIPSELRCFTAENCWCKP